MLAQRNQKKMLKYNKNKTDRHYIKHRKTYPIYWSEESQ
jgi:hypothetical protein